MSNTMALQPPKDLSHHFSHITKQRETSLIKKFYKYFQIPGIGNLAAGMPNASYFPYDTLEARAAQSDRFDLPKTTTSGSKDARVPAPSSSAASASRVIVPHDDAEPSLLHKIDLATGLQYGVATGYPPLYEFLKSFTLEKLHPNIPYDGGAAIILDNGSTDGFSKVLTTFANSWNSERDWTRMKEGLLCEEFAYMAPLQAAKPLGMNVVPVKIDSQGMTVDGPGGLADVLENWDRSKGKMPHLMYTVTAGQNPTSGLMSLARKKQIYAVCQQYDILIIEDEPYWYLQFPSALELSAKYRNVDRAPEYARDNASQQTSSGSVYLDSLVPSYLSIDVDGRVIRLDTFSKTVAPGCRLGWITAQPAIIAKIQTMTEVTTQQPSGFVQSLIAELVLGPSHALGSKGAGKKDTEDKSTGWHMDGWIRWLEGLKTNYERRMQIMSHALEAGKYTFKPTKQPSSTTADDFEIVDKIQMYDFDFPAAGMFLWLRCRFDTHPVFTQIEPARLALALWIFLTTAQNLVLVAPGTMFAASRDIMAEKGWQYFRLCFAAAAEDRLRDFSERLAAGIAAFWDIEDVRVVEKLLEDDEQVVALEEGVRAITFC